MKKRIGILCLVLIALMSVFVLASCGDLELAKPENIQYDGRTLTWNAVEKADHYTVQIDDGNVYEVTSPKYSFSSTAEEFTVKIKAKSKASDIVSSGEAVMTFRSLGKVSDVQIDENGTMTWGVVNGATAYVVRVNGVDKETVTSTSYSNWSEGRNDVQIRAIVEGDGAYYSIPSDVKTLNILGTITAEDIKYDGSLISWKYVSGASGYEVRVNGQIVAANTANTTFEYDSQNANFDVTVKPIGNKVTYFDGKESETKSFLYLETITDIEVQDGIVTWKAVGGATGYKIKLNNVVQSQTVTQTQLKLEANRTYDLEIMPISTDTTYFSSWSSTRSILILPPPVVQWNSDYELDGMANNNAYWDSVSSAAGYTVRLTKPNGDVVIQSFGETQRNFAEAYLDVGVYTVEVKSVAAPSGTVYDSVYSEPLRITRLAAPKPVTENFITSNPANVKAGFTVTFQGVSGATTYRLFKDGNELQSTNRTQFAVGDLIDESITEAQEFNYSVQSVGYVAPGGKDIKLSSLTESSMKFKITVLATPSNADISGYIYSWGSIQKAAGYSISTGSALFTSTETQYELSGLSAGNHEISVCARGNGSDILPSNYTSTIAVKRLEAPSNARIDTTEAAEGQLTFDGVEHAGGYEIVYNNNNNPLPIETQSNINSMISTEGTTIYLQTKANYFSPDRTIYYMSSKPGKSYNFIKFTAPTELKFTNTQLIWNPPSNINTSVYAPTYEVYYADGTTYNGVKNGTSMDISYLEGGQTYEFLVKAIGNGSSYINSDKSTVVSIYKLATPVVNRADGKYVWSGVTGATGYVIYVDGKVAQRYDHVIGATYEYTPKFDELKPYTIEVVAVGDNAITTIDSNKCTIVQEVKQLSTPAFSFSYSHESYNELGTIDVTITTASPYATGYSYSFDGVEKISTAETYSYNPNGTGTIKIRVYAKGGAFDEYGVYYLNSQSVGGTTNYSITLLPTINRDNIKLSAEGVITWTGVTGAVGYNIEILHNGAEVYSASPQGTSTRFEIPSFSKTGTWTIRISSKGNGNKVITSQVTETEFNF